MSLRVRALTILASATLGLILLVFVIARLTIMNRFTLLEEQAMRLDIERARNELTAEIAHLDAVAHDWAAWDDTYQFIVDRNQDYLQSNMVPDTFTGLGINLIVLQDTSGSVVYSRAFDLEQTRDIPVPIEVLDIISSLSAEVNPPDRSRAGLLLTDSDPLAVSIQPILTSAEEGPARGTLYFGKFLDWDLIKSLNDRIQLSFALLEIEDPEIPGGMALEQAADSAVPVILPLDGNTLISYTPLEDIFGRTVYALRVEKPREIFWQGQVTVLFIAVSVLLVGLIVGGLLVLVLERMVLGRIAGLSRAVNRIKETGDHSTRLAVNGNDELDSLAASINEWLAMIERSEADLRRHASEVAALNAVSLDITAHRDLPSLLKKIVEKAVALLDGTGGGMYLCEPEFRRVRCVVSYNTPRDFTGITLEYGEGAAGKVAISGKPLIIRDYSTWEDKAEVYSPDNPFKSVASVPMIWQGTVIGVIHVLHATEAGHFTDHDIELLTQLANQAAIVVENTKLYEQAQQQAREAETLRQASAIVATSLDQDKAVALILEQLERVIPYDSASVQLLRDGSIEIVGGRGWPDNSDVIGLKFPIPGDNPNTKVIQSRKPYLLNDAPSAHAPFKSGPHSHIKSWLGVPLIIHDQVIGMLAIDKSELNYFTTKHIELASAFADQVAISIENARLYSALQQRIDELTALRATFSDITAELELSRLLKAILKRAAKLLNGTGGDLGLFEKASQEIVVAVTYKMGRDYTGTRMSLGEGAMGRVALTHRPVIIDDYRTWEGRSPQFADASWHAVVAAPMLIGKRLVGVIAVADEDPRRRFTANDQNLLTTFAQQAAIAVENAHLYEQAQHQAITDPLTGLYNRRGLFELGQREVNRIRRTKQELSAILLDIDHFKQVNDKYSHAVGDQVLQVLAKRCKESLRDSDLLGRYGGEEFAILLPEANVNEAASIAERLRATIADEPIQTNSGPISITISLGVTSASNGLTDLAILLDRADTAMYQAKRSGRNRVAVI